MMELAQNYWVAAWYSILTFLFTGYCIFLILQFRTYHDQGSLYAAILFGSLALGTFCVAMVRLHGPGVGQSLWFNIQRSSYIGVLLGGWWLIDYRLMLRNGCGIPLRRLWRFWRIFTEGCGYED